MSKLKQRRTRRLKSDVAWWMAEAKDLHARVMEQADEIERLKKLVIRVPMPVLVPREVIEYMSPMRCFVCNGIHPVGVACPFNKITSVVVNG
ncbi:TPA: hypothetical protein O8U29_000931 [Enterobacter kobei]|nr:hypothetical protein [Enterobacter kobei]